ncbi:MAG: hypothetical protein R2778_15920 [Saprospiraceae bacterium]
MMSLHLSDWVGLPYSNTVTVNEQVAVLPLLSTHWNTLVVTPIGNPSPEGIPLIWVGACPNVVE